jgi:hypothetical protein
VTTQLWHLCCRELAEMIVSEQTRRRGECN